MDALGRAVPTHFEVAGGALTQVVEHTSADVSYPVLADPKTFWCDFYTHKCTKFSRSETAFVARHAGVIINGAQGVIVAICGIAGGPLAVGCALVLAPFAGALQDSFVNAAARGKCVELHFLLTPTVLTHWKTESC